MAETDLDYAKVTGRFGITVADTDDTGDNPDIIWCDEGIVRFTPLIGRTAIAGGNPDPWTGGHTVINASIDSEGYLQHLGKRFVVLVDLTSTKVNPRVAPGKATHRVEFINIKAGGTAVAFESNTVRITQEGTDGQGRNNLTELLPVPAANPTPIYRGETGTGVESAYIDGADLILELTDGTSLNAGEVPAGPGGSDIGVASYLNDEESETRAAMSAAVAQQVADDPDYDDTVHQAVVDAAQLVVSSAVKSTLRKTHALSTMAAGKAQRGKALGTQRQMVPVTISAINPQSSGVSLLERSLGTVSYAALPSGLFTTPAAHNLVVNQKIRFKNGERTGMEYLNGSTYYVRSVDSATTFKVSATLGGGSSPDFGGSGTVPAITDLPSFNQTYLAGSQALTITAAGDLFAVPLPHSLNANDAVSVINSTAAGVTSNQTYYVKTVVSPTTFTVSATVNGPTLDVTSDGSGLLGQVNPLYNFTGWRPVQKSAFAPANSYAQPDQTVTTPTPGTPTTGTIAWPLVINTDRFEVSLFNDGSHEHYVMVDGVLVEMVTTAQLSAAGNPSGQTATKLYTLPNSAQRLVEVRTQGAFAGFGVPSSLSLPYASRYLSRTRGNLWYASGDSIIEGTGSNGLFYSLVQWAFRGLEIENGWQAGSGGSGYLAAGVRAALVTRYITDICNQVPIGATVVLCHGLNDPRTTSTDRNNTTAAATTVWDGITSLRPDIDLRINGPFSPRGWGSNGVDYTDGNLTLLDAQFQAAAESRRLPWASPIQERWITGNGRTNAPTGLGNSDLYISTDGTHPSSAGHEYLGSRLGGTLARPFIALL